MEIEKKLLDLQATKFKFDDQTGKFEGYLSVFGGVDSYGDTVHKGAYEDTLKNRKRPVRLRWNHYGPVIGKYTEMFEDDTGLFVRGELTPGHSVASDVLSLLKHGAIDGLSIGYQIIDSSDKSTGGKDLYKLNLIEGSIVEDAADLNAKITSVKSIEEVVSLKELEAIARSKGFTRNEATAFVSKARSIPHGDREDEGHGEREHSQKALSALQALSNTLSKL